MLSGAITQPQLYIYQGSIIVFTELNYMELPMIYQSRIYLPVSLQKPESTTISKTASLIN